MKKLLIFGFILALTSPVAAQSVLKGRVIDKQGNPVAGAKVENAKGKETVTTDMNGRFTLETATDVKKVNVYYTGLNTAKKTAKQDMVIKMARTTWWNKKPEKYRWLVSAQMVVPDNDGFKPAFGLAFGRVKNIGWYVKGVFRKAESTDDNSIWKEDDGTLMYYAENDWMTGEIKSGYWSAVGGVIVRLDSPFYFYGGLGYVDRSVAWEATSGEYYEYEEDSYDGLTIDAGLMFRIGCVMLSGGVQACPSDGAGLAANVGIGITF